MAADRLGRRHCWYHAMAVSRDVRTLLKADTSIKMGPAGSKQRSSHSVRGRDHRRRIAQRWKYRLPQSNASLEPFRERCQGAERKEWLILVAREWLGYARMETERGFGNIVVKSKCRTEYGKTVIRSSCDAASSPCCDIP
jgi:hypothetical protein